MTVTNLGPDTATSVSFGGSLQNPHGATNTSAVATSSTPGVSCSLFVCTLASLLSGDTAALTLSLTFKLDVANVAGSNTVTVSASGHEFDPNPANNSANLDINVIPAMVVTAASIHAIEGPFSGTAATFTSSNSSATASDFIATITWGDGTTSQGTVTANGSGFTITGSHNYEEGSFATLVDVQSGSLHGSATGRATIADGALTASGVDIHPVEGAAFGGLVATFADANPNGTASDFTATIIWGDGQTSTGTVVASSAGFDVSAAHTYVEEGTESITVTITDVGGSSATASSTATVADAPLTIVSATAIKAALNSPAVVVQVVFQDADPNGVPSDYSLRVDWGDGTTSTGTVSAVPGGFMAQAGHVPVDGAYVARTFVADMGGATATVDVPYIIDTTPPVTTATVTGSLGNNGWWKCCQQTQLNLSATDNVSGVAATFFILDGGPTETYTAPVTLSDGIHNIQFWSVDNFGNVETAQTTQVKVDHTPPTVSIAGVVDGGRYSLGTLPAPTFTATDALSGLAGAVGVLTPPGTASGAGTYTFAVTATDNAGNVTVVTVHYFVDYILIGPHVRHRIDMNDKPIDVRFALIDTFGAPITTAVATLLVDGVAATPSGTLNSGDLFSFVPQLNLYEYTMNTSSLTSGVHVLSIVLDDGTQRDVSISVDMSAPLTLDLFSEITTSGLDETVFGDGFRAGSLVTISLDGIVVGTATAAADGTFTFTFTVPLTAPLGFSTVTATGITGSGALLVQTAWLILTG